MAKHTTNAAGTRARYNQQGMPDQISKSASAYQPYGQQTSYSQAYSQWAGQSPNREFDMTAGKKAARKRVVFAIFVILVIVACVVFGVRAFL